MFIYTLKLFVNRFQKITEIHLEFVYLQTDIKHIEINQHAM